MSREFGINLVYIPPCYNTHEMPYAPAGPCTHLGCGALAVKFSRCAAHQRPSWQHSLTPAQRGYDSAWQRLRATILKRDPICPCGARATHCDHIVPKSRGGTDDPDNLQGLCAACHDAKSRRER